MLRAAALSGLVLSVSFGSVAEAQSPAPQAYTLKSQGALADRKLTVTIVRDGPRERIELAIERAGSQATLFDFAARRVYWIGWSGAGTCSSGRYLSARAPIDHDPVTGSADHLAKLAEGRTRKAAGSATVAGRAARIEALTGGKRPSDPDEPWPTRAWVAEEGGYLLKLEGTGPKGQPVTLLEVTELTLGKPQGAALEPPPGCTPTDAEMDDSGQIRAHAEATVTAQATGSAALGATGTATAKATPARLAQLDGLALSVVPQPHEGPCGTKLQLTGTLSVDGPATVRYRFVPNGGALQLQGDAGGQVILDAAGSTSFTLEALLPRSAKGDVRLQAQVIGTKGHDGVLKKSDAAPFQVTCAGK